MQKQNFVLDMTHVREAWSGNLTYFQEHPRCWGEASPYGADVLYAAAEHGFVDLCRLLLEQGADVNGDYERFTPLCGAAVNGDRKTIQCLLEAGANPNGNGDTASTPLIEAVRHGNLDAAVRLVQGGADVNCCQRWSGETALDVALEYCDGKLEKYLRKNGALSGFELPAAETPKARAMMEAVMERTERIVPKPYVAQTDPPVKVWVAVDRKQRRFLFTTGVAEFTTPHNEFYLELPFEWGFRGKGSKMGPYMEAIAAFVRSAAKGEGIVKAQFTVPDPVECHGSWPGKSVVVCSPVLNWWAGDTDSVKRISVLEVFFRAGKKPQGLREK